MRRDVEFLQAAWHAFFASISITVLLASGCSSPSPKPIAAQLQPPPSADLSIEEVRAEARRDAVAAIADGKLYICVAGTIALETPGISEDKAELVHYLPRRPLPSGCVEPRVFRSIAYAEAFNAEIVSFIAKQKQLRAR